MDYKVNQLPNHFTVDVSPAAAVCALADFLAGQGLPVVEARIMYGLDQGKIILNTSKGKEIEMKQQLEKICNNYGKD